MFKKIYLFGFILYMFFACNVYSSNVVTSVYPMKLFLANMLADNDTVINVIPANANPHIFEPTPSVVLQAGKADVFIGIEKSFDGWVEKFLNKKCIKIYLINGDNINPHIWLSPSVMLGKVVLIRKALCKSDLKMCDIYKKKEELFKKRLFFLIKKLRKKTEFLKKIKFFQFHPAFDYFVKDFNVNIIGTVSKHGVTVSPRKYFTLLKIAKLKKVKFIIAGINNNNPLLNGFSEKIEGKIIKLDPTGMNAKNYFQFMENNVNELVNCAVENLK